MFPNSIKFFRLNSGPTLVEKGQLNNSDVRIYTPVIVGGTSTTTVAGTEKLRVVGDALFNGNTTCNIAGNAYGYLTAVRNTSLGAGPTAGGSLTVSLSAVPVNLDLIHPLRFFYKSGAGNVYNDVTNQISSFNLNKSLKQITYTSTIDLSAQTVYFSYCVNAKDGWDVSY